MILITDKDDEFRQNDILILAPTQYLYFKASPTQSRNFHFNFIAKSYAGKGHDDPSLGLLDPGYLPKTGFATLDRILKESELIGEKMDSTTDWTSSKFIPPKPWDWTEQYMESIQLLQTEMASIEFGFNRFLEGSIDCPEKDFWRQYHLHLAWPYILLNQTCSPVA